MDEGEIVALTKNMRQLDTTPEWARCRLPHAWNAALLTLYSASVDALRKKLSNRLKNLWSADLKRKVGRAVQAAAAGSGLLAGLWKKLGGFRLSRPIVSVISIMDGEATIV